MDWLAMLILAVVGNVVSDLIGDAIRQRRDRKRRR